MTTRFVMGQGRRAKQWYTESMHFHYHGNRRVTVQAMAAGQKLFYSRWSDEGGASGNPDPKASESTPSGGSLK
ncbi:hypothetical protein E4U17_001370 [Claviceps sp. LM77 group G4]|nr:hypothetical protein E4U33_001916 [Claviceps sp. LM78 group G4]KAG6042572.1 hypothetical protein E4U17_001370 [Claviceps sp. LM77 group G4]